MAQIRKIDQTAELLAEGYSFKEIAQRMGLTYAATTLHYRNIRKGLGSQAR